MEIKWEPTPKQTEALIRNEFEILYGGARGGGKTDAGQAWLLYDKDHPRYRALVIRKNANDLHDWIDRARNMYLATNAVFVQNEIRFPSGGVIRLGHLKDENAFEKYQGHEYQKILIEEIEQIPTEDSYLKLISSCRSTITELRPQVFLTANPGGRGHSWIKKRFNLRGIPIKPIITADEITGRKRVFVPARIDDNKHLMEKDPTYVHFLDGLPDGLREAWRLGSWDDVVIKGAYYGQMLDQAKREGRITFVPYDPALKVHTVWDLGMDDAMSIGFWQRTSTKTCLIDYYENTGEGFPHYIKYLQDKKYIYGKHFAPFDINQKEQTTGLTRKQGAEKLGINFEVVPSVSIEDGIEKARIMFSRLWISDKLEQFTEAIRQYRKEWDEKMLKFKDKPVHDWTSHPADMLRYTALVEDIMDNEEYENEGYAFNNEKF
jgi:hypothetical protein